METNNLHEKTITDFITIAAEYCRAIDNLHQYSPHLFASYAVKISPLLYIKASILPDFEDYDRDLVEKFVAEEEWTKVKIRLEIIFGKHDNYIETVGRFEENEEASISENLADIYQDLKDFTQLMAFGINDATREAVGEVKRNFTDYWGQRAVNSLKMVHALYIGNKLSKEPLFPDEEVEELD
ncbi:MAG: DUF5063 domain-containing protein [Salinivirgaceae bacterium]|nr:DUF5063 domain-containing protein [Salinivirgaceae bacterium]